MPPGVVFLVKQLRLIGVAYLFIFLVRAVVTTAADSETKTLISFVEASASSTGNETVQGGENCRATNALDRGSFMWCSNEVRSETDVITWTGKLREPRVSKGVRIHWGYSPGKYIIETSLDGISFAQAIDWKVNTRQSEDNFSEDVLFPDRLNLLSLRVSMQQPQHRFFGINFIALLSSGSTLIMLSSGITSPEGEMCLQSEQENPTLGTALVLNYCLFAIEKGDGRELFRLNRDNQIVHEVSQLCVALKDNVVDKGGEVVLDQCKLDANPDGHNQWEVLYDNRFRVLRSGDWCLSQQGLKAGAADIAIQKMVHTNYPRSQDLVHSPDKAVDGSPNSYWASQTFDFPGALPDDAEFSIDLGGIFKLQRVEIDWLHPPAEYSLLVSSDGKSYKEFLHIMANSMNVTSDPLEGVITRFLKLMLVQPHPQYSIVDGKAIYAIRRFSAFANRLKSIVSPCDEVVVSQDARDKYFATFVAEFDATPGLEKMRAKEDLQKKNTDLQRMSNNIDALAEPVETCRKSFLQRQQPEKEYRSAITSKLSSQSVLEQETTPDEFPEDCYDIFLKDTSSVSGFYQIMPACASKSLRLYCDMGSRRGFYVHLLSSTPQSEKPDTEPTAAFNDIKTNNRAALRWPSNVTDICASIGLIPFVPNELEDVALIKQILRIITQNVGANQISAQNALFPIAVTSDDKDNRLLGLDLKSDVSFLLAGLPQNAVVEHKTIAISSAQEGLIGFDWSSGIIGGIFCAPPVSLIDNSSGIPQVSCEAVPRNNPVFQGCPFTSVIVRCPENCVERNNTKTQILNEASSNGNLPQAYGTDTYRDDSAVCLAAKHSGQIGKHGFVNVTFLPGLSDYHGSFQNDVKSLSYHGVVWDRSFHISKPERQCASVTHTSQQQKSFIQLAKTRRSVTEQDEPNMLVTRLAGSIGGDSENSVNEVLLNSDVTKTGDMNERMLQVAGLKLANVRSLLKPAEVTKTVLERDSAALEEEGTVVLQNVYQLQSQVFRKLDGYVKRLDELYSQKELLTGYKSLDLTDLRSVLGSRFWSVFSLDRPPVSLKPETQSPDERITDSVKSADIPWLISRFPEEEFVTSLSHIRARSNQQQIGYVLAYSGPASETRKKENIVCVNSEIYYQSPLLVKNRRFFDGVLLFDYMIQKGSGSFAVAYRMWDSTNMYLYEIQQEKGVKRLVKIVYGTPIEVASKGDGGYLNNVWYHVRIEMNQDVITIYTGAKNEDLRVIFTVSNSEHMSGSFGFFAKDVSLYVARIKFVAAPCKVDVIPPAPPLPPSCSIFNYMEVDKLQYQWRIVNPPKAAVVGLWDTKTQVGGRSKVIIQYNAVYGTDDQFGTLAFEFFPQCEGLVGAIIHYGGPYNWVTVEVGAQLVRVRSISRGAQEAWSFTEHARALVSVDPNAGFLIGEWNRLVVIFSNSTISAELNGFTVLTVELPNTVVIPANGRVGLSAWNCGGLAFDNIELKPQELVTQEYAEMETLKLESFKKENNFNVLRPNLKPLSAKRRPSLLSNTLPVVPLNLVLSCAAGHIIDRKDQCRSLVGAPATERVAEEWDVTTFHRIETATFPCQYNYCSECCNKAVSMSLSAWLAQQQSVCAAFPFLNETLNTLRSRCLTDCSKTDVEARSTAERLWSAISACTINGNTDERLFDARQLSQKEQWSSRGISRFLATLPWRQQLSQGRCVQCCEQQTDIKIRDECRRYCAPFLSPFRQRSQKKRIRVSQFL